MGHAHEPYNNINKKRVRNETLSFLFQVYKTRTSIMESFNSYVLPGTVRTHFLLDCWRKIGKGGSSFSNLLLL